MLSRKNWKNSETSTGVNRYVWVTPGVVNVDENWVKNIQDLGVGRGGCLANCVDSKSGIYRHTCVKLIDS